MPYRHPADRRCAWRVAAQARNGFEIDQHVGNIIGFEGHGHRGVRGRHDKGVSGHGHWIGGPVHHRDAGDAIALSWRASDRHRSPFLRGPRRRRRHRTVFRRVRDDRDGMRGDVVGVDRQREDAGRRNRSAHHARQGQDDRFRRFLVRIVVDRHRERRRSGRAAHREIGRIDRVIRSRAFRRRAGEGDRAAHVARSDGLDDGDGVGPGGLVHRRRRSRELDVGGHDPAARRDGHAVDADVASGRLQDVVEARIAGRGGERVGATARSGARRQIRVGVGSDRAVGGAVIRFFHDEGKVARGRAVANDPIRNFAGRAVEMDGQHVAHGVEPGRAATDAIVPRAARACVIRAQTEIRPAHRQIGIGPSPGPSRRQRRHLPHRRRRPQPRAHQPDQPFLHDPSPLGTR